MSMKLERNHLLLAGLGLVALFYFGDLAYRKFYDEPMQANARLESQLNKRMQEAKKELARATEQARALELLEKRSLPWDAEMARERYQAWLLRLAKDAKMTSTTVDAGDPVSITGTSPGVKESYELYKRFSFTLHGRGDLNQVTDFLYQFYSSGHLQKIRSLSLNPIGQSPMVDMTVAVEALALPTADRKAELNNLEVEHLAQTSIDDYQLIAQRNLFGRGGGRWGWNQIVLRAVTTNVQGTSEAWISTGSGQPTKILPPGKKLSLPVAEFQVVQLNETSAVLDVEGQHYQLNIGQSLADARPVPAPQVAELD